MANIITLQKPEAGQIVTIPVVKDTNLELTFSPGDASLTREGDNLVFSFEDGAKVEVTDFYATVTKENLPDFLIDGQTISGADFFAALGEDLQPAAGQGTNPRGGNFNDFDGANVLGGINSLGGKEYEFNRDGQVEEGQFPGATGPLEVAAAGPAEVGADGGAGGDGDEDDPIVPPVTEEPTKDNVKITALDGLTLTVHEGGLAGGNEAGALTTATGSVTITAPGGLATLTIGGVTVYNADGVTGNTVSSTNANSTFTVASVTDNEDGTYTLTYSYTLGTAYKEHTTDLADDGSGRNTYEGLETFAVVATDADGDSKSVTISVNVVDDIPTLVAADNSVSEGDTVPITGNVLDGSSYGADGVHAVAATAFAWNEAASTAKYGKIVLETDGTYSYTLDNTNADVKIIGTGDTLTETFTYTITDKDGDTVTKTLTITINGTDDQPTVESFSHIFKEDTGVMNADGTVANAGVYEVTGNALTGAKLGDGTAAEHGFAWNMQDPNTGDPYEVNADGSITTPYGAITLNTDGTYEYTLDNASRAVQQLAGKQRNEAGVWVENPETVSEEFSYTYTDKDGSPAEGKITITIKGTNDVPTIEDWTGYVNEGSTIAITGDVVAGTVSLTNTRWAMARLTSTTSCGRLTM